MALSAKTSRNVRACTCNACGACRPAAGPKRARVVKVSAASYHSNWRSTPTTSKPNCYSFRQQAMPRRLELMVSMQILPHANAVGARRPACSSLRTRPLSTALTSCCSLLPATPAAAVAPFPDPRVCWWSPPQAMAAPPWPPHPAGACCRRQSAPCPRSQSPDPPPTPSTTGARTQTLSRWASVPSGGSHALSMCRHPHTAPHSSAPWRPTGWTNTATTVQALLALLLLQQNHSDASHSLNAPHPPAPHPPACTTATCRQVCHRAEALPLCHGCGRLHRPH